MNKTEAVYSMLEYENAFFTNYKLLINYYVRYLTLTTWVSNYTNHALLQ